MCVCVEGGKWERGKGEKRLTLMEFLRSSAGLQLTTLLKLTGFRKCYIENPVLSPAQLHYIPNILSSSPHLSLRPTGLPEGAV